VPKSDLEATQSDPKLKKRKIMQKEASQVALEGLESNDRPLFTRVLKIHELTVKKSFWDEGFLDLAHGRASNYSATDEAILSKCDPTSMHEDLLRYLRQAKASTFSWLYV